MLEGGIIRYVSCVDDSWTMRLCDLRLLGELTNQNGPLADDWFLCFAENDRGWREASLDSEGREVFLDALGKVLGALLRPALALSTDFASRILWPSALSAEPMFSFEDVPAKGTVGKIFGLCDVRQTFSKQALLVLRAEHGDAPGKSFGGKLCAD